ASDEQEVKGVARRMMQMVADINEEHLPGAGRGAGVQVQCATCHGGVRIPIQIGDLLLQTLDSDGAEAALAEYRSLREEYYGRAAYDFGQNPLNQVTESLARRGDLEEALAIIRVNTEYNGDSPFPHVLEAQILMEMGNREDAVRAMERAVELDPESEQLRALLERMRSGGSG
ncbi:MAG: photosynthetic reaction center cytochrome c subunit family protein, partial [Gemmatimonadota bacterium]|nr:photosynthetic reaction center cytochrome c subunit family protein [Gemmatimonadota bacterium]